MNYLEEYETLNTSRVYQRWASKLLLVADEGVLIFIPCIHLEFV
jgi:hypothetical protein